MEFAMFTCYFVGLCAATVCLFINICMKSGAKLDMFDLLVSIIWALSFDIGVTFDILIRETFNAAFWLRVVATVFTTLIAIFKFLIAFQKKD